MIATRLVDWTYGRPAAGVPVVMDREADSGWVEVVKGKTGLDGYVMVPTAGKLWLSRGIYRLTCDTNSYFAELGTDSFYQEVTFIFAVADLAGCSEQTLAVTPQGFVSFITRKASE